MDVKLNKNINYIPSEWFIVEWSCQQQQ